MTIENSNDRNEYTGSGTTGPFTFSYKILSEEELLVIKKHISTETEEVLDLDDDYTVDGVGEGSGSITTVDTVSSSYKIIIIRDPDFTQGSSFTSQRQQSGRTWENTFDAAAMRDIRMKGLIDGSIKLPDGEDPDDYDMRLPSQTARASKFLAFDSGGDLTVTSGVDEVPAGTTISIVTTRAQLKAISSPSSAVTYLMRGFADIGDGGGGLFVWDSASSATDDGGTVISLDVGGSGRFKRIYDGFVNVKWFGATGDGTTDDTDAIDDAVAFVVAAAAKTLYFPKGTYKKTSKITIDNNVCLLGDGRKASTLLFTHTGEGIEAVSPINSSTGLWARVEHLGVTCNNASNADAGIVDTGGAFISITDVYVSGFLYGVVLDQSEVVEIDQLDVLVSAYGGSGDKPRGVWIVNGDDYTALADTYYTNRITIRHSNFNGVTTNNYGIVDDGGVNHEIVGCNINACETGIRAAGVRGLTIEENGIEGQGGNSVVLCNTKLDAATYTGPCIGISISKNSVATASGSYNIDVQDAMGGRITDNIFANAVGIVLSQNPHPGAGLTISGNAMSAFISAGAFSVLDSSTSAALYAHIINQSSSTRVSASITAGARQVTPASMFGISVGKTLLCVNSNGTNPESVMVTATNATTFNATFASDKGANSVVYGTDPYRELTGTWTPTLIGSGANGTHTYSTRKGFYFRSGKKISATCNLAISAKDAALNGTISVSGLPFTQSALDGTIAVVSVPLYSGFNFATGYQVLGGIVTGSQIDLRKSGSNTTLTTVTDAEIPGNTVTLYFTVDYYGNP